MNHRNISQHKPSTQRNSLNMDRAVYEQLLRKLELEHHNKASPTNPNRVYTRLLYHQPYLELQIESNDRNRQSFTVAARNISCGGISVLHSSYTYTGSKVSTTLDRIDGKPYKATGSIVRCDHRGGVVHEIGIRFDKPIIVQEFIRPDILQCVRSRESVRPDQLEGTLLVVTDDPNITPLIRQFLVNTSIKYAFADNPQQAMQRNPEEHDMILVCLGTQGTPETEFVRSLRTQGYTRPVLLTGSCLDESTGNLIRLSTADAFVASPLSENDLLCAIADYMLTPWNEQILAAVRSHHAAQTTSALRAQLAKHALLLDQHTRAQNPVQVYACCAKISAIAPLLAHTQLRDAAQRVAESVAEHGDLNPNNEAIAQIKAMCVESSKAA